MSWPSPPALRVLHAVRLLGFGDETAIGRRAEVPTALCQEMLREYLGRGWASKTAFLESRGYSLTDRGRAANENQLALERERADPAGVIWEQYRAFLPLNARLLQACTRWQIAPTPDDLLAENRHLDADWDRAVLAELGSLGRSLRPLVASLAGVLDRFRGYDERFARALDRAREGQVEWVDRSDLDSCHRVWFELHEDLVATLGVTRDRE